MTDLSACCGVAACREPLTVTVKEALALIGIGRTRLYELIAAGDITTIKLGRRRLIHMQSLRRLAEGEVGARLPYVKPEQLLMPLTGPAMQRDRTRRRQRMGDDCGRRL